MPIVSPSVRNAVPAAGSTGVFIARLVWTVIVTSSVVRIWVIARSFFWQDDYIHIWRAWNAPASDLILQNWNGHVEPGSMTAIWLMTTWWPQNWLPAATVLIALSLALPTVFWLSLRRLYGVGLPAAVAAMLFAAWPGLLVIESWLSAGLELFWLLFCLLTIYAFAAQWRRPGYWGSIFIVLGCAFSERALFTLGLLVTALLLQAEGGLTSRLRTVWRRWKQSLQPLLIVTAVLGVVLVVVSRQHTERSAPLATAEWLGGIAEAGMNGALRGVSGLPQRWGTVRGTFPLAPPAWEVVALLVLVLLAMVAAWRTDRHQTGVSLLIVAAWCVVEPVLVITARSAFISEVGAVALTDPRYAVVGTLALLFCVAAWRPGSVTVPVRRIAVAVVVIALLGSAVNALRIGAVVDGAQSRSWLARARSAFVGEGKPAMVSTPSPPFMLNTFFFGVDAAGEQIDLGTTRTLLDVGRATPRFNVATGVPVGVSNSGRSGLVDVSPVRSRTSEGFGADCSVRVADAWTRVPMSPSGLGNPILAIDLLARGPVQISARGERWEQALTIEPGLRTAWFFPAPGPFDGFSLRVVSTDQSLCVGSARAGQPFVAEPQ